MHKIRHLLIFIDSESHVWLDVGRCHAKVVQTVKSRCKEMGPDHESFSTCIMQPF